MLLALLLFAAAAQDYSQRGFLENRLTLYPQEVVNDRARAVGESLFRYEGFYKPMTALQISGTFDVRIDTHHQVSREFAVSWQDRERQRPMAAIRRLSAIFHTGPFTLEAGKQFIR